MDIICVSSFLLSLQVRSSARSVVFDFNASLSDVASVSSMSLSVEKMQREKSELLMDVVRIFFCIHYSDRVE